MDFKLSCIIRYQLLVMITKRTLNLVFETDKKNVQELSVCVVHVYNHIYRTHEKSFCNRLNNQFGNLQSAKKFTDHILQKPFYFSISSNNIYGNIELTFSASEDNTL